MANAQKFERPPFDAALNAWTTLLTQRGFSADCLWIFDENLCFERDPAGAFKVGYQTKFTPPPSEAAQIAYEDFADSAARLVFYRLGSARGKSVCLVLCDAWFESKGESEGYVRRDEWLMSFRPGGRNEIPEITDEPRWKNRILRDRPLHDLDFCMSLQSIHELMAHGRVLTSYEHYALRFLHAWRRLLGQHE